MMRLSYNNFSRPGNTTFEFYMTITRMAYGIREYFLGTSSAGTGKTAAKDDQRQAEL
jgi:hypothetical protein